MKEFFKKHRDKLLWSFPIDKKIFKFIKEFFKENSTDSFYRIPVIVIILGVAVVFIFFYWLGLGISAPSGKIEMAAMIYRNRGFALAAIIGIGLAIWARWQANKQIALKRKANASERYEKAARMLGDKVLAVRIAGCHALENLGIDDEKMTTQCIQLLSTFIVNPFDDKDESHKDETDEDKTVNKPIKQDTQAALNGLSAIGSYYYEKSEKTVLKKANLTGADLKGADLKGADLRDATLIKADLRGADLFKANLTGALLRHANLTGDLAHANLSSADLFRAELTGAFLLAANLTGASLTRAYLAGADLTGADLRSANLTGADLTDADLRHVNNLTKEQIISAEFRGKALPYLSEELLQNEEIQKWLLEHQQEN